MRVSHGYDCGGGGEARAESAEGVEDELPIRDGGVVVGEGVGEFFWRRQ